MNFEQIQNMWSEDSVINDSKLDSESLRIPQLHSKYLNLYSDYIILKEKYEMEQKIIVRELWEYYSGKSEIPFEIKLLKQDIPMYIESDDRYQKCLNKIKYYSSISSFLKEVLSSINSRSFVIKNSIEFKKFINGVV
jgi:hypothetical protein